MNDKELMLLEKLATTVGSSAEHVIDSYTQWALAAALAWWAVGGGCIGVAILLWRCTASTESPKMDYALKSFLRIAAAFCVLVGVLFIACNLPDLVAPRAVAIHRLLQDVVP